jgi:hypothetical protein
MGDYQDTFNKGIAADYVTVDYMDAKVARRDAEIARLTAEVAELRAAQPRPMAEAPRDGTEIRLYIKGLVLKAVWTSDGFDRWFLPEQHFPVVTDDEADGWLPLPPAPTTEAT